MDCGVCELVRAVESCADCDLPLCGDCTVHCDVCSKPVCPLHIRTTSRGRKLCRPCRDERRAERKRRQEAVLRVVEGKEETKEEVRAPDDVGTPDDVGAPDKVGAPDDVPGGAEDGVMSFASLQQEVGEAPEALKEPDESRPILRASSYKPPSRTSWTLAFIFFGVSGIVLWASVPDLRYIMWPFEAKGPEFAADMDPQIKDVNTLRDTSNISQLNVFFHIPFFVISWAVLLAYLFGVVTIVFPTLRIVIPQARRRWKNRKERRR